MKKNTEKIRQLLQQDSVSESDVIHFLTLIRKDLENIRYDNYRDLKLFCDWSLHTTIDRSGSYLVTLIHNTINKNKNDNSSVLIQEVSKSLILSFKNQLHHFLDNSHLSTDIINIEEKWKSFLVNIFEIIEQSPVIIKNTFEQNLQKEPLKQGMWVKEISIIKCCILGEQNNESFCLSVRTSDITEIIIPLTPV